MNILITRPGAVHAGVLMGGRHDGGLLGQDEVARLQVRAGHAAHALARRARLQPEEGGFAHLRGETATVSTQATNTIIWSLASQHLRGF